LFVQTFDLPSLLDLTRIDAVHKNGELRVSIPYEDPASRYREINIKRS
jgi:HSP20 family protein